MLRSITISTRNVNSSLAKSTTKDARLRWPNGAYSWPDPRLESPLVAPNAYREASVPILPDKARDGAIYRSPDPVLVPKGLLEREGAVANVVFPSAIDRRDELGAPERLRRLLWHGGLSDWRGASECASDAAAGRSRLPFATGGERGYPMLQFARRAGAGCVGPPAGSRQAGTGMPAGRQNAAAATPQHCRRRSQGSALADH